MKFPRQTSISESAAISASASPTFSAASLTQSGSEGRDATDSATLSKNAHANVASATSTSNDNTVASAASRFVYCPSRRVDCKSYSNGSSANSSNASHASASHNSASTSADGRASRSQSVSQSAESQPPSSSGPSSASSTSISASSSDSTSASASASASASDTASSAPTSSQSITPSVTQSAPGTASSTSYTTLVTSINGELTTIVSPLPTSLSTAGSSVTSAQRTAIIAGATAAGVGVVLLILGALFVYKRHKGRKLEFSEAIGRFRRQGQGAGGVGLLDEEGFDDDDSVPMRRYHDNAGSRSLNMSSSTLGPPQSPAPSLLRQRAETGSVFREEGVWPPPQGDRFVDPLVGVGTGESLVQIVDDIMGPSPHAQKASNASGSSTAYVPAAHVSGDPTPRGTIPSMSSATASLYADPFRDVSHSTTPSDPSLYYERHGASPSMSSNYTSASRPTTPQSLLGLPAGAATTPKKPSPLAAATLPPSAMTSWLSRSPKKRGLSGSQTSAEE
ncbi:hypothetical protein B0H10DRAFT_2001486 [Mycena sp. CBHHK59/15]|nr:hypothetical protein B0H10DRAFT_2001486 [Mycena sp. CBHHK59/15]